MTKIVDQNALQYTISKLNPVCGNMELILPKVAYTTGGKSAISNMIKSVLSVNNNGLIMSKKQHNVVQFYISGTTSGLIKTDDSIYFGCGVYMGNGTDTFEKNTGVLHAYMFPSSNELYDIKIKLQNGTYTDIE